MKSTRCLLTLRSPEDDPEKSSAMISDVCVLMTRTSEGIVMSGEEHKVIDSHSFVRMMCVRLFWLIFLSMYLVRLLTNDYRAQ